MVWLLAVALALALASCSGPREPQHRAKPTCEQLRRSARHELGDTGGEIERHCRRD